MSFNESDTSYRRLYYPVSCRCRRPTMMCPFGLFLVLLPLRWGLTHWLTVFAFFLVTTATCRLTHGRCPLWQHERRGRPVERWRRRSFRIYSGSHFYRPCHLYHVCGTFCWCVASLLARALCLMTWMTCSRARVRPQIWATLLGCFMCMGKERVGFLSGRPFEREAPDPSTPKRTGEQTERRDLYKSGDPWNSTATKSRLVFLFSGLVVITFSILLVTRGLTELQATVDTVHASSIAVQQITVEGQEIISKGLRDLRSRAASVRSTLIK